MAVDFDGVEVETASGQVLRAGLLVGADGSHSAIRELQNIRRIGWQYDQEAVVATVLTEKPHNDIARQWFTREGPVALLPLADPHLCSLIWSSTRAAKLRELEDNEFCKALEEVTESTQGRVVAVDKRFGFPLQQRHVFRYFKDRVVLLGDAAHTIHPLAGQGANLGIEDGRVLAQEIKAAVLDGVDPGSRETLRKYAARRQPKNLVVGAVMEGFKQLYTLDNPGVNWVRNAGMRGFGRTPALKTAVMQLAVNGY